MSTHNWDEDLTDPASEQELVQRISKRCAYFAQSFEAYSAKLSTVGFTTAELNKALLGNCVESYFADIQRLKLFHGMERADRYKIAGYTFKWFSKIRPIQVGGLVPKDQTAQRWMLLINADFAVFQAINIAKIDRTKMGNDLARLLVYTAHYRDIEGGTMAILFASLARQYPRTPRLAVVAA